MQLTSSQAVRQLPQSIKGIAIDVYKTGWCNKIGWTANDHHADAISGTKPCQALPSHGYHATNQPRWQNGLETHGGRQCLFDLARELTAYLATTSASRSTRNSRHRSGTRLKHGSSRILHFSGGLPPRTR